MDDGALTVPNFLRHFGNNVVGGSLGHHLGEVTNIVYNLYWKSSS